MDDAPMGCLLGWPRGTLKQWLVALASFALLITAFYFAFTAMGY